jgi:hypothetical protein
LGGCALFTVAANGASSLPSPLLNKHGFSTVALKISLCFGGAIGPAE